MPGKRTKKVSAKTQRQLRSSMYLKIVVAVLALLAIGLLGKSLLMHESYKVLGATTLIAKGGDDSGGSNSGSGSSNNDDSDDDDSDSSDDEGESSHSGSGSSGSSSSKSSGSGSSGSSSITTSIPDSTRVLCTGPDGKQFETKRKDCEELNNTWNKTATFIVLPNKSQTVKTETRTRATQPSTSPYISETPEMDDDTGIRTKTEAKSDEERTEVRLSETERIRTRTKDGRTRIDITSGGIKTRYEIRDDRVIIKAEREDGTEVELEDDTLFKIDDRLAKDSIKVSTAGAQRFLVQRGTTGAVTNFPLSVDLATNTLYVNTPNGQKELTVLPEEAVQNLILGNIVSRLGGTTVSDEVVNNNLTSVSQLISLGERNGVPVYEIKGISDQKLLGFIPVQIEKDVAVSAESGNAVVIEQSLASRILDAISF